MIHLTNLSGVQFCLNDELIETIEAIPESKIMLTTGKFILVQESKEEIVRRIIVFRRQVYAQEIQPDMSRYDRDEGPDLSEPE